MSDPPPLFAEAAFRLREACEVVVFSGAGISAESGIPTFRDEGGLWEAFPADQFATWQGLMQVGVREPQRLAAFIRAVLTPIVAARPNAAHLAIADLERYLPVTVVTQNIDRLHQDAGSTTVHEVHGSLFEIVTKSGRFERLLSRPELASVVAGLDRIRQRRIVLPRLLWAVRPLLGIGRRGLYRPRLVLFGSAMAEPDWTAAREAAARCDLVLQVGCSGVVLPAATIPEIARAAGATVVNVDPEAGGGDLDLPGSAVRIVPALVEAAFAER